MVPRFGGSLVPRSSGSLVRTYSGSLVLYWPMPCLRPLRGMRTRVKRVVHRPRTQRTTEPGEGDLLTRQAGRERRSRPYRACQAGSMTQGYSSVTEPRGGWGGVASSISRLSEPRCVGHPIALGPGRDRTPSVASRGCGHPVHLLAGCYFLVRAFVLGRRIQVGRRWWPTRSRSPPVLTWPAPAHRTAAGRWTRAGRSRTRRPAAPRSNRGPRRACAPRRRG